MLNDIKKHNTVVQIFESWAKLTPNKTALKFKDGSLSYEELNSRANILARQLVAHGVVSGDTVALVMQRSINQIVSLLAIMKSGAAYLPIDTNNPLLRNLHCLNESKVTHIITDQACNDLLQNKRRVIEPTVFSPTSNKNQTSNLDVKVTSNDRCYVMYTSGSTGNPKGVEIAHRSVVRLVCNTNYITVSPDDSIFQLAPLSFDASTFEIWGALLNGSTLVLYSGSTLDPNLLSKELKSNDVSILWLTSALFHLIVTRSLFVLSDVKILLAGGDVLNPALINKVLDTFEDVTVINGYGPTENTTFTCCHVMTKANKPDSLVPIGQAINGTSVHILNEELQPVAQGEVGELYVSGAGVALGYVNSLPSQNDFFYNTDIAQGLIYRTGDLVRNKYNIEFVGRKDNQVKIRGYRVSLEEVQTNLAKLGPVDEALVLLNQFESGEQQLVAYIQLHPEDDLSPAMIKQQLAMQLPSYMIPNVIHLCEELPINKNGKLEKQALSKVD